MVSGYPISTNLPRVEGLLADTRDLGCHNLDLTKLQAIEPKKRRIKGQMTTQNDHLGKRQASHLEQLDWGMKMKRKMCTLQSYRAGVTL